MRLKQAVGKVVVARNGQQARFWKNVAVDPIPGRDFPRERRGEITIKPGECRAQCGMRMRIEPAGFVHRFQRGSEMAEGLPVERRFLGGKVKREIDPGLLRGMVGLKGDKAAEHICIGPAGGIGRSFQ